MSVLKKVLGTDTSHLMKFGFFTSSWKRFTRKWFWGSWKQLKHQVDWWVFGFAFLKAQICPEVTIKKVKKRLSAWRLVSAFRWALGAVPLLSVGQSVWIEVLNTCMSLCQEEHVADMWCCSHWHEERQRESPEPRLAAVYAGSLDALEGLQQRGNFAGDCG